MTPDRPLLLFAEDDHEDWMLIEDTLCECGADCCDVERVENGEELMERLRDKTQPMPSVVMLDLKMPKMDGIEVLQAMRADAELAHLPVVMMTTSELETHIFDAYRKGVNSYVIKPMSPKAMRVLLDKLYEYWLHTVKLPTMAGA